MAVLLVARITSPTRRHSRGEMMDETEAIKQAIVRLAHMVANHIGKNNYKEICEILYPNCTKDWK